MDRHPRKNSTPGLLPGRVLERLNSLEEDMGDAEKEIDLVRGDVRQIKYALFMISGMLAGDLVGISELIQSVL